MEEQRRIKAEKELEVARLRAQQERAKDKQAEKVLGVRLFALVLPRVRNYLI